MDDTSPVTLWIVGAGELAGVGRHVTDAVSAGIPGWRIKVLAPSGPLLRTLPPEVAIEADFGPGFGLRASSATIRHVVSQVRPTLVHSHLAWADFATLAARPGVPRVSTEHGISGFRTTYAAGALDQAITLGAHRIRMWRTDHLICVSDATAGVVRSRWRPPRSLPLTVIRNGFDRTQPRPTAHAAGGSDHLQPTTPTVGYLGRLAPEKRVDTLLVAFAQILQRLPAARLRIAGIGACQLELEDLAQSLGISDSVDFVGWIPKERSSEWLASIDVLCLPSVWENCSYALLEALAGRCGAVAAPAGGNRELLPPRALADPENATQFGAAILRQLADPGERPGLPRKYPDVQHMTRAIAEVYRTASGRS